MSHFDELGKSLLHQSLNTSDPIDGSPDLLREKVFNLLSSQRFDRPMVKDGNFERLNLNLLKDRHSFFPQRIKQRGMKSRIERKAGGRHRLPGEGKGNRLFHPFLFSGKDEMHRAIIIGNRELKTIEVLADLLDFLQGETDNAG